MRPQDLLIPRPEGLYCPPGDFFIDPVRPVAARADHPCPFRPRPRRPRRRARHARDARHHGDPLRRGLRRRARRRPAYGETARRRRRRRSPSTPPATCSARPRSRSTHGGLRIVASGDYKRAPTRPAPPSSRSPATSSSPRRPSACRSSATRPPRDEIAKLLASLAQFPERTHLVGVYALGKAQRVIAPAARRRLRRADLHPRRAAPALRLLRQRRASTSATSPTPPSTRGTRERLRRRRSSLGPPSAFADRLGRAASPTRSSASPPAGCRSAPAPASAASSCR